MGNGLLVVNDLLLPQFHRNGSFKNFCLNMLSEISRSIVQIKKNINNNKKNIYVGNLYSLLIIDMKFQDN